MCKHQNENCCQPKKNDTVDTIMTIVSLPFVALIAVPVMIVQSIN